MLPSMAVTSNLVNKYSTLPLQHLAVEYVLTNNLTQLRGLESTTTTLAAYSSGRLQE